MSQKILVIEDEASLQETLQYNLTRAGYQVEVVGDGAEALETARAWQPDLILMDIMLPGLDGLEITRILRQEMSAPIIMLTARDDEIDRVLGLEIGADDYLTKPFSMRELLARVKAQIRRVRLVRDEMRSSDNAPKNKFTFGNLALNLNRREATLNGEVISLKPKEYDLLLFLAQNPGKVLTRDRILEEVWGWDFGGGSRTVDVHIRWLREKFETAPSSPARIITIRGIGYRFEG